MDLLYKPDWEQIKENYKDWWEGKYFGRCAIAVYAHRKNPIDIPPAEPVDIYQKWYDPDYFSWVNQYNLSHTFLVLKYYPSGMEAIQVIQQFLPFLVVLCILEIFCHHFNYQA